MTVPDELNHIGRRDQDALRKAMIAIQGKVDKFAQRRNNPRLTPTAITRWLAMRPLMADGEFTAPSLARYAGVSTCTARRRLENYVDHGLLDTEIRKHTRYFWRADK